MRASWEGCGGSGLEEAEELWREEVAGETMATMEEKGLAESRSSEHCSHLPCVEPPFHFVRGVLKGFPDVVARQWYDGLTFAALFDAASDHPSPVAVGVEDLDPPSVTRGGGRRRLWIPLGWQDQNLTGADNPLAQGEVREREEGG